MTPQEIAEFVMETKNDLYYAAMHDDIDIKKLEVRLSKALDIIEDMTKEATEDQIDISNLCAELSFLRSMKDAVEGYREQDKTGWYGNVKDADTVDDMLDTILAGEGMNE